MQRLTVILVLLLGCAVTAAAQVVEIDDLTAPTSPAFILLEVSPAAVERPENAKTFAVNLLNKLSSTKGLPQNYALEVTPYWLASHTGLEFHEYQKPSPGQSIMQSFALSVATVPMPGATTGADPVGTRLGMGMRMNIFNGKPDTALETKVGLLADAQDRFLTARRAGDAAGAATAGMDLEKYALEIQSLDTERVGFFLALAAGQVWAFPEDDAARRTAEKSGIWLTPSYRFRACNVGRDEPCEQRVDIVGVVRELKSTGQDARWDYGGRLVWRASRELYLSAESLHRRDRLAAGTVTAQAGSDRTVGLLEYRIKKDLVLYGSFGRDFMKDNGVKPLVSLFGLNLGFGTAPRVLADKAEP